MDAFQQVTAVLADLATIAAAIGLYWVYRTLKYNNVDAWHHAHVQYMQEATHEMRSRVFAHYDTGDSFSSWSDEDKAAGMNLCRVLEAVCFFEHALGKAFWPSFGYPVGKAYLLLRDALQEARDTDRRPNKWNTFERIGKRALKMFPEIQKNFGYKAAHS